MPELTGHYYPEDPTEPWTQNRDLRVDFKIVYSTKDFDTNGIFYMGQRRRIEGKNYESIKDHLKLAIANLMRDNRQVGRVPCPVVLDKGQKTESITEILCI